MLDISLVRRAFRTVLLPTTGSTPVGLGTTSGLLPANKWNWENEEFTPPSPTDDTRLWCAEHLAVINEPPVAIGGQIMVEGFYIAAVNFPKGRGSEKADALTLAIMNAVKSSLVIKTSPFAVAMYEAGQLIAATSGFTPGNDNVVVSVYEKKRGGEAEISRKLAFEDVWISQPVRFFWRAFVTNQ